jgi:small subunit ribosomal protein S14
MAKKSVINRQAKREKLVAKYAAKRAVLKRQAKNFKLSAEERQTAREDLSRLPRNSSPVRLRVRCIVTGRGRGVYRKFGVSRIVFRDLAHNGFLPGVTKASW